MESSHSLKDPLLSNGARNDDDESKDSSTVSSAASEAGNIKIKDHDECEKVEVREPESEVVAEVKRATRLAWPLVLFNLVVLSVPVITLTFVGHLGELELASASIASSFATVTAFSVMGGLGSTLETLCGQAYGAQNYRMMGIYLQSSLIVCLSTSFIILSLWLNVAKVFKAMGQDPVVARFAERYLLFMLPGVFGSGILRPTSKFLQSQGIVTPVMICSCVVMVLHVPVCYILIHVLDFGFIGGALANSFTYQILTLFVVVYTLCSGRFTETFQGFSWEAFSHVKDYLKLAIPSTFMLCLEYWTAEILVLCAGLLPNPQLQLSLLSISLNTCTVASMVPIGLGGAAATRIGNELGAHRAMAAKLAGKVIVGLSFVSTCIVASSILLARNVWGKAFSSDADVLGSVRRATPLIALAVLLDGFQGVLTGMARGCGRQEIGAYINLAAFYGFGIPSGLYLGFRLKIGAPGLWIGLCVGELIQCLLLTLLMVTTNWDKMATDAEKRVGFKTPLPKYLEKQQSEPSDQ